MSVSVYERFVHMVRLRIFPAAAGMFLLAQSGTVQAQFTTNDAITTLQIFSDGGDDLIAEVSLDVLADRSAIGAYCMAAGPSSVELKVAIVRGILVATEGAPGEAGLELSGLAQQCCPLFTAVSVDERIVYGAELALEARRAFDKNRRISGRMKTLVGSCSDDILDRSFSLALGNDRIGLFIAQDDQSSSVQYRTASHSDAASRADFD